MKRETAIIRGHRQLPTLPRCGFFTSMLRKSHFCRACRWPQRHYLPRRQRHFRAVADERALFCGGSCSARNRARRLCYRRTSLRSNLKGLPNYSVAITLALPAEDYEVDYFAKKHSISNLWPSSASSGTATIASCSHRAPLLDEPTTAATSGQRRLSSVEAAQIGALKLGPATLATFATLGGPEG